MQVLARKPAGYALELADIVSMAVKRSRARDRAYAAGALAAFALASCGTAGGPPTSVAVAAGLPTAAATYGARADAAFVTLERRLYAAPGRWTACIPDRCGTVVRDWGADSLTYSLYLRWTVSRDAAIPSMLEALSTTIPWYAPCRRACTLWSDVPMWDAVAAVRGYEVTGSGAALRKGRRAFDAVAGGDTFAQGACPAIDYQRPHGGRDHLKTLETDSNYIKAALLLFEATSERRFLQAAIAKYAAVRRYFLDPSVPLYSVYVFDDGRSCRQLSKRFYASVNGNMISNGLRLAALSGKAGYAREAAATARAVSRYLNDDAGIYADLQADNDIAEPLVEAMYDLAVGQHDAAARDWLLVNAAAATPSRSGSYERFFDGPAPAGPVSAWSVNGGLAVAIAAGGLNRRGAIGPAPWRNARFVRSAIVTTPATIAFTGSAIALFGTIGQACCETGHVRVFIDGMQTFDGTGIWQNKSPARHRLERSVLLSWRWKKAGRHTIALQPGEPNAKEGTSYIRLDGYEYVP